MAAWRAEAFYPNVGSGRRFWILREPATSVELRGAIVHVPAFAEEMNKSRLMVASTARALAKHGWAVLTIDLDGCGDSPGEFGEATWESWIEDATCAYRWASERFDTRCWLWGLRAGCLIAAAAGARMGGSIPLLLWQPVLSGRLHLVQFLRHKLASAALTQADERIGTKDLRKQLAAGASLEVAGYMVSSQLADALERAELRLDAQQTPVIWLEIRTEQQPQLAPASVLRIEQLRGRAVPVSSAVVTGLPFWQTLEISEAPALLDATVEALDNSRVVLC